jgi:hypothetical protein
MKFKDFGYLPNAPAEVRFSPRRPKNNLFDRSAGWTEDRAHG